MYPVVQCHGVMMDLQRKDPAVRVAIVMSGHLRSLNRLRPQQQQIIERVRREHDVALFVHTWEDHASSGDLVHGAVAALSPAAVRIDPPGSFEEPDLLAPGSAGREADMGVAQRFTSMWTSIARGFELVLAAEHASGVLFDVVVRTRPDVVWDIARELGRYSGTARFAQYHAGKLEPSDLAFIVPRFDADVVFSLATSIRNFAASYAKYGYRVLVPEFALGYYLDWAGIAWEAAYWDAVLVRPDGEEWWFDGDADSRAYKSGRGIHGRFGGGLPCRPGGPTVPERIGMEVAYNIGAHDEAGRALVAQAPALVEAMAADDPAAAAMLVTAFQGSPCRLGGVMLTGMIVEAHGRWPAAIGSAFRSFPIAAVRFAWSAAGFLTRRWLRRFRTSMRLGLKPRLRPPTSIQPALYAEAGRP